MRSIKLKLGIKILLLLTTTYLVISIATGFIFYYLIPSEYFKYYPFVGLFYLLTGYMFYYSMIRSRNTTQVKLLNVYMAGRMIKLFLTILFLTLSIYFLHPHKRAFALMVIGNYIVFSGLELHIYSLFNKRLIKHEKKQKELH